MTGFKLAEDTTLYGAEEAGSGVRGKEACGKQCAAMRSSCLGFAVEEHNANSKCLINNPRGNAVTQKKDGFIYMQEGKG